MYHTYISLIRDIIGSIYQILNTLLVFRKVRIILQLVLIFYVEFYKGNLNR